MNTPAFNSTPSARTLLLALLIAAAVLAIYFPALHGDWLWDDDILIHDNRTVHDPAGLWKIWFEPQKLVDYLPITASAEWLQWQMFGENTLGYHLVNVALHVLGALLLWRLFSKLGLRLAWLGALLFAIHPVAVESVAWMSELKNTLSLPPFILAMIAWVDYDRAGNRADYLRALVLFLVAMLCKATIVMFPVILLLYAWYRRGKIGPADIIASSPFFVVSLILGLVTLQYLHPSMGGRNVDLGGPLSRFALAGTIIAFYLSKSLLPFGLLPIYPKWAVNPFSPLPWLTWLALIVAAGACWKARASWGRHAALGLGFFFINLLPFVGFTQGAYMGFTWVMDHIMYVPVIGLVGLAAAACDLLAARLTQAARPWCLGALAVIVVLLGWGSFAYAAIFTDQGTLWTYELQRNPNSEVACNNLGLYELDHRQYPAAIDHFRAALRLKPDFAYAHNGLGNALSLTGHHADAGAEYQAALQVDPNYAEAHNGLASVLMAAGKLDEARTHLELSIHEKPYYADAYCNLGLIDAQQGKIADAIHQFEIAQKLRPNDPRIAQELASLRAQR